MIPTVLLEATQCQTVENPEQMGIGLIPDHSHLVQVIIFYFV